MTRQIGILIGQRGGRKPLAAQSQSKAGDQWGFFQAKKIKMIRVLNTFSG